MRPPKPSPRNIQGPRQLTDLEHAIVVLIQLLARQIALDIAQHDDQPKGEKDAE